MSDFCYNLDDCGSVGDVIEYLDMEHPRFKDICDIRLINTDRTAYRLSDAYKRNNTAEWNILNDQKHEDTFMYKYLNWCIDNKELYSEEKFVEILNDHCKDYDVPEDDEVVIALRLSDQLVTVKDDFKNYMRLIKHKLRDINLKKVTIVIGLHYPTAKSFSKDRLQADIDTMDKLIIAFTKLGHSVTLRSSISPDRDFYYLYKAKNLITIQSGYGALAGYFNPTENKTLISKEGKGRAMFDHGFWGSTIKNIKYYGNVNYKVKDFLLIIQAGDKDSGGDILVNVLYGLFSPDKKVRTIKHESDPTPLTYSDDEAVRVLKSVDTCIDFKHMIQCNVLYAFSRRREPGMNRRACSVGASENNYFVCDYDKLVVSSTNSYEDIVDYVYDKVKKYVPVSVEVDKESAVSRLKDMTIVAERMEHESIYHMDTFYHVSGKGINETIKPIENELVSKRYQIYKNEKAVISTIMFNRDGYKNRDTLWNRVKKLEGRNVTNGVFYYRDRWLPKFIEDYKFFILLHKPEDVVIYRFNKMYLSDHLHKRMHMKDLHNVINSPSYNAILEGRLKNQFRTFCGSISEDYLSYNKLLQSRICRYLLYNAPNITFVPLWKPSDNLVYLNEVCGTDFSIPEYNYSYDKDLVDNCERENMYLQRYIDGDKDTISAQG
jgi:hypothetical protein